MKLILGIGAALVAASGCSEMYVAGSLQPDARAIGCLDVAATAVKRAEAEGPVVHVRFGNRCARSVVVDFTALHVVAIDRFERRVDTVVFDRWHEIEAERLDGGGMGDEFLEFRPRSPLEIAWIEVELAGLDADHPGPARRVLLRVPGHDPEVTP